MENNHFFLNKCPLLPEAGSPENDVSYITHRAPALALSCHGRTVSLSNTMGHELGIHSSMHGHWAAVVMEGRRHGK